MNANKQDAGGLPELPGCIIDFCRDLPPRRAEDLCTYIRYYGELCRAAPAGAGEVEDWMVELFDEVYEREWNRAADEADDRHKAIIGPADRHATREAIAALLRKLQQVAEHG